ncbi:MAG: hypothetical protein CR988_06615 [Treponema sp.]|nr:MAG: hypothetical protein CR988_06615 [Treponema sp.]
MSIEEGAVFLAFFSLMPVIKSGYLCFQHVGLLRETKKELPLLLYHFAWVLIATASLSFLSLKHSSKEGSYMRLRLYCKEKIKRLCEGAGWRLANFKIYSIEEIFQIKLNFAFYLELYFLLFYN